MKRARGAPAGSAVGIDVGGTKIAAGLVAGGSGRILAREELATRPERGGEAVLSDCAALALALGGGEVPVGVGLCELVSLCGRPESADTVDWRSRIRIAGMRNTRSVAMATNTSVALASGRPSR